MYRTIVVGTDGSATATEAIHHAIELARTCGAALHVVSVRPSAPALVGAPEVGAIPFDAGGVDSFVDEVLDAAARAARDAGVATETHGPVGSPAHCLLEVARQVDADLVVVGSRGMHGARRALGSTPNSVTHHARCHVLVVHTS